MKLRKAPLMGSNLTLTDTYFQQFIEIIKKRVRDDDDDFLMLCVGETGTGKSNIMLEAMELYNPELSVDYVGLDPKDHATALNAAKNYKGLRFCALDEADVQKRNAITKYNKRLISLYSAIRGLNIFHWWNNPSLDMIDKFFVKEKINAVMYIFTRGKPLRYYYLFRKEAIVKILEKEKGSLTLKMLRKHKKEALFMGWFKQYEGELLEPYMEKKKARMEVHVENFFEEFADDDKQRICDIAKDIKMSRTGIYGRINILKNRGDWIEGEDYVQSGAKPYILPKGKEKLDFNSILKKNQNKPDIGTSGQNTPLYKHAKGEADEC